MAKNGVHTTAASSCRLRFTLHHFSDGELLDIGATNYSDGDAGAPSFGLMIHDVQPDDLRAIRSAITLHLNALRKDD